MTFKVGDEVLFNPHGGNRVVDFTNHLRKGRILHIIKNPNKPHMYILVAKGNVGEHPAFVSYVTKQLEEGDLWE